MSWRLLKNLWSSKRPAWRVIRIAVTICLAVTASIMLFEEKLIFFPSQYPEGYWNIERASPAEGRVAARIEDCYFKTSDGLTLHGWYCTPVGKLNGRVETLSPEAVLLWFHGNAGNVADRRENIDCLIQLPASLLIVDYRGYGRSEGRPSESGLYKDAQAAWDYLTGERNVSPRRIIIFGESLGGAPAIDLATKVSPAGLIIQSSFTSVPDMAAAVLPGAPRFLMRTKMDSVNKVGRLACRKLFIHGRDDEVVPFKLGRKLFDAATEPKEFFEARGHHNDVYILGGAPYYDKIREFIRECGLAV